MMGQDMRHNLERLRAEVCQANKDLVSFGLVTLTWGNVSGITSDRTRVVIKPSGVPYADLTPDHMVVVDLEGRIVEGLLNPSIDTLSHILLYRTFTMIGGITHSHSPYATMFAQARREIPCLGTTHADHFRGPVPVTRPLTAEEVGRDYESSTGKVIVERFANLDPVAVPGVLVAGHAPFVWGPTPCASLDNAVALEAIARVAHGTLALNGTAVLEAHVLEKHHQRMRGKDAYYGQNEPGGRQGSRS
jgi:L-ribulose-5-phosphate 4-epimerase